MSSLKASKEQVFQRRLAFLCPLYLSPSLAGYGKSLSLLSCLLSLTGSRSKGGHGDVSRSHSSRRIQEASDSTAASRRRDTGRVLRDITRYSLHANLGQDYGLV